MASDTSRSDGARAGSVVDFAMSPLSGLLFGFAAFALFSGHDSIVKYLGATYSVFQILFVAGLFSFVPVTILMAADNRLDNFRPHHPWLLAARAATNVIAMSAAFYAFSVLPLTQVYALIFATPLLITVLAVPFLGETIRLRRGLAVLVGLIGVLIVIRPGGADFSLGHGAALLAATAGAFGAIVVRKLGRTERATVIIPYPMYASLLVMATLQPFVFKPMQLSDMALMAAVGLMAVGAQMCIIAAYRRAAASVIAPVQYSQMLWAVFYGALFFNEAPDLWVGVGSAVIIASGLYIVAREVKPDVSETTPLLRNPNIRPDTGPTPGPNVHRDLDR
ncbi:MAG: DMT family transporter [Pseudomonadota bacterium]